MKSLVIGELCSVRGSIGRTAMSIILANVFQNGEKEYSKRELEILLLSMFIPKPSFENIQSIFKCSQMKFKTVS